MYLKWRLLLNEYARFSQFFNFLVFFLINESLKLILSHQEWCVKYDISNQYNTPCRQQECVTHNANMENVIQRYEITLLQL